MTLKNGFIALISFVLGGVFCILIKKMSAFSIDTSISIELNPLDIASFIITVGLAYYISKVLTKQNEKEKEEKLLISKSISKFQIELDKGIHDILERNEFNTVFSRSKFKILRSKLSSIVKTAEKYELIDKNIGASVSLKEELTNIWELFTNTVIPAELAGERTTSTTPSDREVEIIAINTSTELKLIKMNELIFEFIIEINKK